MNITEAISILKIHAQWRLGADIVSIEPKELTKAMQVVIDHHIVDTNKMVSNNKQTSVEWLYEELLAQFYLQIDSLMSEEIKSKIEQAKAMHKEEVKKAIMFGDCRGEISTYATSEQYYNETFNTKRNGALQ